MKLAITGGLLVLPDRVAAGTITVEDGRIVRIAEEGTEAAAEVTDGSRIVDARGKYVLPGLIDLHCDAIEKEVQPRPNTLFPLQMALLEFERKLPVHGVTTMYHSLSLGVGLSLRGDHLMTELADLIRDYRSRRPVVRNRIHLRYEVSHLDGLPILERYVREGLIDYLSLMDHSPGQGQYRKPGAFERYVMKNQGVDQTEVAAIVEELESRRRRIDWDRIRGITAEAAERGIAIASHDDDTPARVDESMGLGAGVSEFPITLETAKHAAGKGMYVCVGAPNVVRGASHDSNLRAAEAIAAGAAHVLCSDYYPASLLTAVFKLAADGIMPLPEACAMASLNAARAVGTDDRLGSIAEGKAADLIVVDRYDGHPWVTHALVGGIVVYEAGVR